MGWVSVRCTKTNLKMICLCLVILFTHSACSSIFGKKDHDYETSKPIQNPFGDFYEASNKNKNQGIVLRSRRGAHSVEVELPKENHERTNFVIPMTPAQFKQNRGTAASDGALGYKGHKTGISDREISKTFPKGTSEQAVERADIESGLGLRPAEDDTPIADTSYLGAIDTVKQLYRKGRYEAGLIELDSLLRRYPTDPRLYEMRGTLLDRLGYKTLAVQAWNQSLELNPDNNPLKKFLNRRLAGEEKKAK